MGQHDLYISTKKQVASIKTIVDTTKNKVKIINDFFCSHFKNNANIIIIWDKYILLKIIMQKTL